METVLIVGLGNTGARYRHTRHNIGFAALDALAQALSCDGWAERKSLQAEVASVEEGDKRIILAKPTTFMNASGEAVLALVKKYNLNRQHLWLVHDDIDLTLGTLRIAYDRSAGGNNGVQSVIDKLGQQQFWRFRLGVAGVERAETPADQYVLQKFAPKENIVADALIKTTVDALQLALEQGITKAQNTFSR